MCTHGDTLDVRVWIPDRLSHSGQERWETKPVDRCIAPIVEALLDAGVMTVGSCCGHGKNAGSIALDDGRELLVVADRDQAEWLGQQSAIYGTEESDDG